MIYGSAIVIARESRGLEPAELAAKLGVDVELLHAWEQERIKPTIWQQQRLSFALQYPTRFFQERHIELRGPTSLDWHSFEYTCDGCNKAIDSPHDHIWRGEQDYHPWCLPVGK